ncbi:glucose-6-phosphate dehydrogenase [Microbacterium sp. ARD31]|uniref:glucose-6-phosphate dehydrogenase n=1 Tax=Microbacterium sp. ARD31 TaxID=2962576 RepID=UPI0028821989|nr:glucose-6-phosphate dehydrogenase [Microbacterium sp. ARD31]MDT0180511.1 glucose-6-phosphate dehydrogenase [Microbacterium sp. ARD31]
MKITTSSDWRDGLPFGTPVLVSEVMPGEPTRCASCPSDAPVLERTDLWAVKHPHPKNPAGFVRFYCLEHRPAPAREPESVVRPGDAPRARRSPTARAATTRTPRPTPSADRPRAVCPTCFVEVPSTGICGMCGERVG